jgi:hypothetical protein
MYGKNNLAIKPESIYRYISTIRNVTETIRTGTEMVYETARPTFTPSYNIDNNKFSNNIKNNFKNG